jgi:ParB-like chromosome segregation protein Spo0J
MPMIALSNLDPHPANANRMSNATLSKLVEHIRATGEYPPLIVRRQPADAMGARYQLLDGHHRAKALAQLGYDHARCEVWEADDQRAIMLLLTLNRLQGQDDPQRRGALLEALSRSTPVAAMARLLPEQEQRIKSLLATVQAPMLRIPPAVGNLPEAVTFFLTGVQRTRLMAKLERVDCDRSRALVQLLELELEPATTTA